MNLYGMVGNDSVNNSDKLGLIRNPNIPVPPLPEIEPLPEPSKNQVMTVLTLLWGGCYCTAPDGTLSECNRTFGFGIESQLELVSRPFGSRVFIALRNLTKLKARKMAMENCKGDCKILKIDKTQVSGTISHDGREVYETTTADGPPVWRKPRILETI
jgi:hypothetical protein